MTQPTPWPRPLPVMLDPAELDLSAISDADLAAHVARIGAYLKATAPGDGAGPAVAGSEGLADLALSIAEEIAARLAAQNRRIADLERLTETDELTRVLNRRGFGRRLRQTLAEARRHDEPGVLIFIDLDGFKAVNDTQGHAAGDALLCHLAQWLLADVRDSDAVGRLGGDEFAVLMPRTPWEDGLSRAERLSRDLHRQTVTLPEATLTLNASFGVHGFSGREGCAEEVLRQADLAMYQVKRARRAEGALRGRGPLSLAAVAARV
ncbi:GGDEF domain-containing protein [Roseospirillum parvum]|uniref:Diguanylate cyclase (GGDEF) domain-containing protein n=1 Tax=Roseospirillum parvum TaxID=83401 RepID=A0A1G7UNV4_9PROT|nr:GGDEF domain-containing protein [Roseospirillum parvum]SDG48911.1 diguanylate cyclase (GGDEF) domain-containing protein [Roseospirillum parvum]